MKIVSVGAGRLAHHLIPALYNVGHTILQVYSHGQSHAESLSKLVCSESVTDLGDLNRDGDIYIISVSDDVLSEVGEVVRGLCPHSLIVHTAGTKPLNILKGDKAGVIYPMQTFSFDKSLDFSKIHIFIEAKHEIDTQCLLDLCSGISDHVYMMTSDKRCYLHLAAVFACNFVNHCYDIADQILQTIGVPFDVMYGLIDETCTKVHQLKPKDAQTGPASRGDTKVLSSHIQMLSDYPDIQKIYQLISENIKKRSFYDQL